jgi:hypothetical protein
MPYPYTTTSIADALAYAHERAYAAGAQAVILLDAIQAELLVLIGPHEEYLAGRHVVCTVAAKP